MEADRFARPHYYVPLRHDLRWVLALLGVYRAVAHDRLEYVSFESDGWLELRADFRNRWGALRVMPIIASRRENLRQLTSYRHLTIGNQAARQRQPASRTILLEMNLDDGDKRIQESVDVLWNEVSSAMGAIKAKVLRVPVTLLWTQKGRTDLCSILDSFASGVEADDH